MSSQITENGFELERFEDKLSDRIDTWKESFGDDLDTSDESIAGQIINIDVKEDCENDELTQDSYDSNDPAKATGTALDNICSYSDVQRLSALSTRVKVFCRGDDSTQIPTGNKVSKSAGNYIFSSIADAVISVDAGSECFFTIKEVANSTIYTLTVTQDVTTGTYTYTSDASATESEILNGLVSDINGDSTLPITAELDESRLRIYADDLESTDYEFVVTTTDYIEIDEVGVVVLFDCDDTGAIIINAEEINTINTPISGWSSVVNIESGTTGRARETDDALRLRREESIQTSAASTVPGLKKALLQNVDGVTTVIILSNRTLTANDEGAPKSFQAVVVGGDDTDIAQEIWESQPAGIISDGTTSTIIVDSEGENQTIKHTRPEDVYIWVNYTYTIDSTAATNVEDLIAASLVSFAGTEFQIGGDVLYQKLYEAIMEVQGVIKVPLLELAGQTALTPVPDPVDYDSDNIEISKIQVSEFATSRISGASV